jgi:hypothetical protein
MACGKTHKSWKTFGPFLWENGPSRIADTHKTNALAAPQRDFLRSKNYFSILYQSIGLRLPQNATFCKVAQFELVSNGSLGRKKAQCGTMPQDVFCCWNFHWVS